MSITKAKPTAKYSDFTQHITNQFPEWHDIRTQRDSISSRITDATYGRVLSNINEFEAQGLFAQRTITQASDISPDKAYLLDVASVDVEADRLSNLLRNSNFQYWTNPNRMPDYWSVSADNNEELMQLVNGHADNNLLGGWALGFESHDGESIPFDMVRAYQVYDLPEDDESRDFTLSVFSRRLGVTAIPSTYFYLYATVTEDDDSTTTYTTEITDTTDWQKFIVKFTHPNKVKSIECGARFLHSITADVSFLAFDGFSLINSSANIFWNKHVEDRPSWITTPQDGLSVSVVSRSGPRSSLLTEIEEPEITKALLPNEAEIDFVIPEEGAVWSVPEPQVSQLANGYTFQDRPVSQGLVVGTAESITKYGWPNWVNGRLVKFNLSNPDQIMSTYIPSFNIVNPDPEDEGLVEAISTIKLMVCTIYNNKVWIMGRIQAGSGLKHMSGFGGMLMVLDPALPKQENEDDLDLENNPMFLPIEATYFFPIDSGIGFGTSGYGEGPWGGDTPPIFLDHFTMNFTGPTTIETDMILGYRSVIELKHNYFVHDTTTGQAVLLRDARRDIDGGSIVAC